MATFDPATGVITSTRTLTPKRFINAAKDPVLANGTLVGSITDHADGSTLTETTTTKQPEYRTNQFGTKPGYWTDGVDDRIGGNTTAAFDWSTVIVLAKLPVTLTTSAGQGSIGYISGMPGGWAEGFLLGSNTGGLANELLTMQYPQGSRSAYTESGGSFAAGNHIWTSWWDAGTGFYTFKVDGTTKTTNASTVQSATVPTQLITNESLLYLGGTPNNEFYSQRTYGVWLAYAEVLTAEEMAAVHSWMQDEWGVAVSDYNPDWRPAFSWSLGNTQPTSSGFTLDYSAVTRAEGGTGPANNDGLLLAVSHSATRDYGPGAQWTLINSIANGTAGSDNVLKVYRRTWKTGDATTTTLTLLSGTAHTLTAVVLGYAGVTVDSAAPVADVANLVSSGQTNVTSLSPGPLTAPTDGCLALFGTSASTSAKTFTGPAEMAERFDNGNTIGWLAAYTQDAASGSTGTKTVTQDASAKMNAALVVLKPIPASTDHVATVADPVGLVDSVTVEHVVGHTATAWTGGSAWTGTDTWGPVTRPRLITPELGKNIGTAVTSVAVSVPDLKGATAILLQASIRYGSTTNPTLTASGLGATWNLALLKDDTQNVVMQGLLVGTGALTTGTVTLTSSAALEEVAVIAWGITDHASTPINAVVGGDPGTADTATATVTVTPTVNRSLLLGMVASRISGVSAAGANYTLVLDDYLSGTAGGAASVYASTEVRSAAHPAANAATVVDFALDAARDWAMIGAAIAPRAVTSGNLLTYNSSTAISRTETYTLRATGTFNVADATAPHGGQLGYVTCDTDGGTSCTVRIESVAVTPGEVISYEASWRWRAGATIRRCMANGYWVDSAGASLGGVSSISSQWATPTTTGWTRGARDSVVVPANAAKFVLELSIIDNPVIGDAADFDQIAVYQGPLPNAWSAPPEPTGTDHTATVTDPVGLTDSVTVEQVVAHTAEVTDSIGLVDGSATQTIAVELVDSVGATDSTTAETVVAQAFAQEVTDGVGLLDTAEPAATSQRDLTDGVGLLDSAAESRDADRTVTDGVGLLDDTTLVKEQTREPVDAVGLVDSTTAILTATREITSPVGLVDSREVEAAGVREAEITDLVGVTDSATSTSTAARDATDPVGLTDSVAAGLTQPVTLTDPVGLADSTEQAGTSARAATDAVGLVDTTTTDVAGVVDVEVTDPVGLVDAPTTAATASRTATDGLGVLDGIVVATAGAVALDVTSVVGLTDSTDRTGTSARAATDAVGLADSVEVLVLRSLEITDSVGVIDDAGAGVQSLLLAERFVTDPVGLLDPAGVSGSQALEITDTLAVAESVVAGRTVALEVTDTLGVTDSVESGRGFALDVTDGLGVVDVVEAAAELAVEIADYLGLVDSLLIGGTGVLNEAIGIADSLGFALGDLSLPTSRTLVISAENRIMVVKVDVRTLVEA